MECPFCKEDIKDGAIKCKHCSSDLSQSAAEKNKQSSAATQKLIEYDAFQYYATCWKKFATFSGRARRREYWFFTLYNILASFMLGIIDSVFGIYDPEIGMGLFGAIYSLTVIIPTLAVSVRRLHDTGRSGWWLTLVFLPIIGVIVLLVWICTDSEEASNQHGDNPKYQRTEY